MTLEIIGAGFGRTGTMSLKFALETLGFGPCYHMIEEMEHPEHDSVWQDATDSKAVDWDVLFDGYRSAVDWPTAAFWPELAQHYSAAKVILTTREPERWFESMANTIFPTLLAAPGPNNVVPTAHRRMTYSVIIERTFANQTVDREFVLEVFRQNTERVFREIPANRLLHYQPGDGWESLCAFLGVDIPDEPFPHSNKTVEFRQWAGLDQ